MRRLGCGRRPRARGARSRLRRGEHAPACPRLDAPDPTSGHVSPPRGGSSIRGRWPSTPMAGGRGYDARRARRRLHSDVLLRLASRCDDIARRRDRPRRSRASRPPGRAWCCGGCNTCATRGRSPTPSAWLTGRSSGTRRRGSLAGRSPTSGPPGCHRGRRARSRRRWSAKGRRGTGPANRSPA